MADEFRRILEVARGRAQADLFLAGGRILNVFTGEIYPAGIAISGGRIASVGPEREAREIVDISGLTVLPGFIDAHVHLESSLLCPGEFSRALISRGTTTVICDPHEIANVAGSAGIRWILKATEETDLSVYINLPSCVPASDMATSGARLEMKDLVEFMDHPRVLGLGEMMNFPGVVQGDEGVLEKLRAFQKRVIDGHAPGLRGDDLQAYIAAGIGSDHECVEADEALEKLRLGMFILLREGTAARNLVDLLPVITRENSTRCALCTDDRHPLDLIRQGHLDHLLRIAVARGLKPAEAVRLATLNPSVIYGLDERGAIAPGRVADLVLCRDLDDIRAEAVYCSGRCVAEMGRPVKKYSSRGDNPSLGAFDIDREKVDFVIRDHGDPVRIIEMTEGNLLSGMSIRRMPAEDGFLTADADRQIAKIAVIERHRESGRKGLGFIHGLGLKAGAIASSVAHDHHNLVVAGMDDESMLTAVRVLTECRGGLIAVRGSHVLSLLQLPIGGLMTDQPLEVVGQAMESLLQAAGQLGSTLEDPFMLLSFSALEVIPRLKLTDRGLVDVEGFTLVPLESDQEAQ